MSSRPPLVSVLMPVRDAAPHLVTCLRSLERQTLRRFEVVAVDDGSSDGSSELLAEWARREPRLRVVHTPPLGLVPALNRGLELCRGELVARMDADDAIPPRRLELQCQALRDDPGLDVVSCLVKHFPRQQVAGGFRVYEGWLNGLRYHEDILRERFVESPIPHPSMMMRRRRLLRAGGYRDVGWPEDYDLWLRLAEAGARFHKISRFLYFWRDHPARLTRTDRRYAVERFLACKAHYLARGPLRGCSRVLMWGAGQTGRRLSKHLLRLEVPLTDFIDIAPRKIGRTVRAKPVHAPSELPRLWRQTPGTLLLTAVSSRGARDLIRAQLRAARLREGRDYWCAA